MHKLVNKRLYHRLVDVFGKGGVRIHRAGRKGSFKYGAGEEQYSKVRLVRAGNEVGEEFSTSCPFCGDTRGRLYFNHFWGTKNKYDGSRILWPVHCYNEECQSDPKNRQELARMILGTDRVRLEINSVAEEEDAGPRKVKLPGILQPLDQLAKDTPSHPAIQWCLERGYDPRELGSMYGVGFCAHTFNDTHPCRNRIVAPFYTRQDGEVVLAGWTARKIYEDVEGPKWLHASAPTGGIVYGLGSAAKYETLVIVEGPGDVWATGPWSCGLLGKTLKDEKLLRIRRSLLRNETPNRTVVVMLDPKQSSVERRRGKQHHIDAALERLRSVLDCKILAVRLPDFSDPGGLDRNMLQHYIKLACEKEGFEPSFRKVKNAGVNSK